MVIEKTTKAYLRAVGKTMGHKRSSQVEGYKKVSYWNYTNKARYIL